jgi:hypothetical protein
MHLDPVHEIPVGAPVYTEDGEQVGQVKEIDAGFFKVDASMQPDYWLPDSAVRSYTAERVTLAFNKDQLSSHKVDHSASASQL